jgi:diphthamide biosynthesis protein 2
MSEQHASTVEKVSPRGSVPIEVYYELDRLAKQVLARSISPRDGWLCRVALQFPDNLLCDAPLVCWAMEDALVDYQHSDSPLPPLVFILGDTTFGPCCPDEVSALHLEADVLVHYGHACLSPALSLPVIYSFGITDMNVSECAEQVLEQVRRDSVDHLLLLYEVRYHHAMEALQIQLRERGGLTILSGQIPTPSGKTDCGEPSIENTACCQEEGTESNCQEQVMGSNCKAEQEAESTEEHTMFVVGGLELLADVDLSSHTLLFVGDGDTSSRQYVNTMLRFLSMPFGPSRHWTYSPATYALKKELPSGLHRQLNRRFYLTQKARDANVYGILVGTLSQRHFRSVVSSLRNAIQDKGKSCYTFAVGKINEAKLANFGEIDCFVLVACGACFCCRVNISFTTLTFRFFSLLGENSLLDNERDLHVPVITPLELDIALGNVEWGSMAYSLDYNDFLTTQRSSSAKISGNEDEDTPYFSLVSGKFVDVKRHNELDLTVLAGKGQLTAYKSEAAAYLKKREYQGLEANIGKTQVHAAVPGQSGIASDYGNR